MGECVDVKREGGVATVVMHRKGNNGIAADLMEELSAAFKEVGADPEVRVVVLGSEYEKYFSVGADLTSMGGIDRDAPDAEDRIAEMTLKLQQGFNEIAACPKPVIARINGHALGGGCELTLCCDYRVMVEDGRAKIGQSESALGIIPGAGGTQRLPRLIGKAKALPMLLESTRLSAAQAAAVGLVNRAVAPEELDAAVAELAGRLAGAATLALGLIKDSVNRGLEVDLEKGLEIEARNFAKATLSQDAVIGIMSFLQKQEPEFTGR
ncbi:MAG TPA: enoyl-CoA hydratase/isomerase family protein [Candidatus Dormibacteraeota bacterium]|jgi:enoyl-CoA hydratase/carnithine racemase